MSDRHPAIIELAAPWIGFLIGCSLAVIAYSIGGIGRWYFLLSAALLAVGLVVCAASPWLVKDNDPAGRGLLSIFACGGYLLLLIGLLFHSFSVDGLPVD